MNTKSSELPEERRQWMTFCWIRRNHYIILIIALLAAQTPPAQQWINYISELMSKVPGVHANAISSIFLTRAVLDRRGPHLCFYLWLASMLLEYNYLTSSPFRWGYLHIWNVSIPWIVAVHLFITVRLCSWSLGATLVPGQRRMPTHHPQSSVWECRDLKAVRLVTFPPIKVRWPFVLISKCQSYASVTLDKTVSSSEVLSRLRRSGRLQERITTTIITILKLLIHVNQILASTGRWSIGRPNLMLGIILNLDFLLITAKSDFSRLWFFNELLYHQALEVDGRYYELTREGWFANSIKFTTGLVANDTRKPLYSTPHGYTFFTHHEIYDTGEELVLMSPGYELITYNCITLRSNLFNRIKDDRYANYSRRRRGIGYANAMVSLPVTIASLAKSSLIAYNETRRASGADANYILSAAQMVMEVLTALVEARAMAYWSSTTYGQVYRNRTALPLAIGLMLFLRILTVENSELPALPRIFNTPKPYLNFYSLWPVNCFLKAKFALFILSPRQNGRWINEVYFDGRFRVATEPSWIREYYPGEREEINRRVPGILTLGKEGLGQVSVQVKSVCSRPLDGERTQSVPFWPQSPREAMLLYVAATVFFRYR